MEWVKQTYNKQYENWVPWLEDKYLAWFGENKTSYVAKGMSFLRHERLPGGIACGGSFTIISMQMSFLMHEANQSFSLSYASFSGHGIHGRSNLAPFTSALTNMDFL